MQGLLSSQSILEPTKDTEIVTLRDSTATHANAVDVTVSMDQIHENTAVSEGFALSRPELEDRIRAAVAAGVPQEGTPEYFEYFTPQTCSA